MKRAITNGLMAVLFAASAGAADDVTITKVIGTEFPGEYKHPASFTELDNGDLYLAYYGGDGEYEDSKVWGMRQKKGETAWTTPAPCVRRAGLRRARARRR